MDDHGWKLWMAPRAARWRVSVKQTWPPIKAGSHADVLTAGPEVRRSRDPEDDVAEQEKGGRVDGGERPIHGPRTTTEEEKATRGGRVGRAHHNQRGGDEERELCGHDGASPLW